MHTYSTGVLPAVILGHNVGKSTPEQRHASYLRHRERLLLISKEYQLANKDAIRGQRHAHRQQKGEAYKAAKREYYLKNKETILAKQKIRYASMDKGAKIIYQRGLHLKKKYFPDLTIEGAVQAYADLFNQQNGLCAICNKPEVKVDPQNNKVCALAVDHCHDTKRVRGLLCFTCNTNLGRFEKIIPKVLNYVGYKNE